MRVLLILCLTTVLGACAHSPAYDPQDPLEGMNRKIYSFNATADKYIAKPIAQGYAAVTPAPARKSVSNFFSNLAYPGTIVNQFLQGKFGQGTSDIGRFLVNTTLGIGGLFDVASTWGLDKHQEDFGQTLGSWAVGQGWYVMLPLLGPSSNRGLVGFVGDDQFNANSWLELGLGLNAGIDLELSFGEAVALTAVDLVNVRAQLLRADALLEDQNDPYIFVRTAYLQKLENDVYDGNPPEEDFDDFDDFE